MTRIHERLVPLPWVQAMKTKKTHYKQVPLRKVQKILEVQDRQLPREAKQAGMYRNKGKEKVA